MSDDSVAILSFNREASAYVDEPPELRDAAEFFKSLAAPMRDYQYINLDHDNQLHQPPGTGIATSLIYVFLSYTASS